MTLEELHDDLDALAALPPDWDRGYKGSSGMTVSKAAIEHARPIGAALLAAGHSNFGAFPSWDAGQPSYVVCFESDDWSVTANEDGSLRASMWRQATPEHPTELDVHTEERAFPAGATDAVLAFLTETIDE